MMKIAGYILKFENCTYRHTRVYDFYHSPQATPFCCQSFYSEIWKCRPFRRFDLNISTSTPSQLESHLYTLTVSHAHWCLPAVDKTHSSLWLILPAVKVFARLQFPSCESTMVRLSLHRQSNSLRWSVHMVKPKFIGIGGLVWCIESNFWIFYLLAYLPT